ncbi:DAK2 domain protein [Cooperia oncophora]
MLFSEQTELAKKCISAVCNKMKEVEAELNGLDGAAGDGDCGSTFVHAAKAIDERMKNAEVKSAQQLLHDLSEVFEQEVGGTGGALYALMLSTASESFATSITSKEFADALTRASEAVQKYGGAKPGDRTLVIRLRVDVFDSSKLPLILCYQVDSIHAAVEKIKSGESNWDVILEASTKAAQSTAQMKARAGRASYTAKEVQTRPDAGAVAIAYFMHAIWDTIKRGH